MTECIPLFISQSSISTEINNTGTWRFVRPVYQEKTAPCSDACPVGEDIPKIEMLASRGMFKEAWQTILTENPFPAVCGRVCFHFCEGSCNRAEFDSPIAVHCLERFLGDQAIAQKFPIPESAFENNGKRVAIAGSGPAGLSAAWFLSRLGYSCDIFEADGKPGGLLRWGIPAYRLPKRTVKDEIARIIAQGVQIRCKSPISESFLKDAEGHYDAVFIACGYTNPIRMKIPGEDMIRDGLELLHQIRSSDEPACMSGTAAVIGGGNTAIDVARSLLRLGVKPVIVYRRRKEDMPAFAHEVEMAIREGIELTELSAPIRIEHQNGQFLLTLQKMKAIPSESGRAQIIPDGNKTEMLAVNQAFRAIGAEAKENWLIPPKENTLKLSHCTFIEQEMPVIFGGDLSNPIKSVTDAIASGKQAAMALDIFFKQGRIEETLAGCRVGSGTALSMEIYIGGARKYRNLHTVSFEEVVTDYFQPADRVQPQSKNILSFADIEQTLDSDSAIEESKRCFNCGICNDCDNCRLFCPEIAVFADDLRQINLKYCKGCGICVTECPRNAMSLEEEAA